MKTLKQDANRWIAAGTLAVMMVGSVATLGITSTPAQAADSDTWKKVAIGSAAVTGYGLIRGKGKVATIGAVATGGSYYMYRRQKKKEQRRIAWYKQRYGSRWREHYKAGS